MAKRFSVDISHANSTGIPYFSEFDSQKMGWIESKDLVLLESSVAEGQFSRILRLHIKINGNAI